MKTAPSLLTLTPLLVVRGAPRAIEFYVAALGAREVARYEDRARGTLSHADMAIDDLAFSITEEARAWTADAPPSLGGSPVVLQLRVANVAATFERMHGAGATVVFPLIEFCAERMARMRDPFGHLWILSQRIEELSSEEVQQRRDAWVASTRRPKT
jgi:PhnB protein